MSPAPLRTLLVDDERLARKYLRTLLAAHTHEVTIVGEAGSVPHAAALARELQPDLIFLDVQMPPGNGFDLLPLLDPAPAVVFVTAHDEFAVRAFATSAVDYLLKPVAPARLAEALHRVRHGRHPAPISSDQLGPGDSLVLRGGGRLRRVSLADIVALEAEGAYTRVHLAAEPSMFILRNLSVWEEMLPPSRFLRLDRSLLINLDRVSALDARSRDEAHLTLASAPSVQFTLGRAALVRLRAALA